MQELLKRIRISLLDFFFPTLCRICNGPLGEARWVCEKCLQRIIIVNPPVCHICGLPLSPSFMGTERPLCKDCKNEKRYFSMARSVAIYEGVMRECIHLLKYDGKTGLSKPLGRMMVTLIKDEGIEGDMIIPVPLHPRKRRERGFNQAELLSHEISKGINIPVDTKKLIKKKDTPSQTDLTRLERIKNVKGSFCVRGGFKGKRILLIDDVFTTGATINECSKVLLEAGAEDVYVITLGRKT